jgi:two-component system, NarL family, sensor histidine kinase DegS
MSETLPQPQTREFADRLTSLAIECREELEHSSQSLQEIALLLNQTQSEVDRLTQRENQQASRLREMESSLESFSRSEIRDTYIASHEIQMRLFMMRSQLDVLKSRRDTIESQQGKLRILLSLAEVNRAQAGEATSSIRSTRNMDGTNILGAETGDFARELIEAREQERVRIARQLIDGPAQVLANLILRSEIVKRAAEVAPEQVPGEVALLRDLAAKSLLDIRRSIFEMRPLVLDELGLVPTLRRYASDFARENGATITISGPERDDSIAGHTRVALFRLIQQALLSMVTPGEGTNLQADLRFEEAQLVVRLDAAIGQKAVIMVGRFVEDSYTRDTLDLVGGSIQHESLSSGTRITIIVPLGLR